MFPDYTEIEQTLANYCVRVRVNFLKISTAGLSVLFLKEIMATGRGAISKSIGNTLSGGSVALKRKTEPGRIER